MPFSDEPPELRNLPHLRFDGRRVALVIGNGGYRHTPLLKNPGNDANAVAATLEGLGFEVVGGSSLDLDYGSMAARLRDFGRSLREGGDVSTALLFFAGHGLQVAGRNYLVPVDAALAEEADVGSELFELQYILNQMERPRRSSIVLLDACRNNPLARNLARAMGLTDTRSTNIVGGLAEQKVVAGTLIAYATQPGHVAYDGDRANGFFTEALLACMKAPGLEIELMLKDVRAMVVKATESKPHGPQVPWAHSSLLGKFFFNPASELQPLAPQPTTTGVLHLAAQEWAQLQASTDIDRLKHFARHFAGYYGELALDRAAELERQRDAAKQQGQKIVRPQRHKEETSLRVSVSDSVVAVSAGDSLRDLDVAPEMVLVPPGEYLMGSKDGEGEANERPQHKVSIGDALLVGKYPVTFAEWDGAVAAGASVARQPSDQGWGRGRRPVINVSWHDASAYVVWLTKVTGKPYRLLSEAEWEYCCRAGSITAYSFGDDIAKTQAQFSEGRWSSAKQTTEAGQFPANAFGLYDMHGNVWEWCGDSWHDDYQQAPADGSTWTTGKGYSRVFRGGSWLGLPRFVRSAVRGGAQPGDRSYDLGFRVARTLMPE